MSWPLSKGTVHPICEQSSHYLLPPCWQKVRWSFFVVHKSSIRLNNETQMKNIKMSLKSKVSRSPEIPNWFNKYVIFTLNMWSSLRSNTFGRFGLKMVKNNFSSNHFWILGLPKTWIMQDEPFGAISCILVLFLDVPTMFCWLLNFTRLSISMITTEKVI